MGKPGYLVMSQKEIDRLQIMEQLSAKKLKQIEAASLLGITARQIRRLQKRYRQSGANGLLCARRGQPSSNRKSEQLKNSTIELIKKHYSDFGPTLAHEKLLQSHDLNLSVETLRKWMIEAELWKGKSRRVAPHHPMRERRAAYGELIQIDGSPHDWFEARSPRCTLLVAIDDATSKLQVLRFEKQETTQGYFSLMEAYLNQYGRPLALYSDKHSIFRMHLKEVASGDGRTQFGRAMHELDIDLICANSPQAKGRVEKANRTLQDRLVKELRLKGISDIDTANDFLAIFVADYNKRFAKEAAQATDAHRKTLPNAKVLALIFSEQTHRKLSKNLEMSYKNVIYQITPVGKGYSLRHTTVTVSEREGIVSLIHKGNLLTYNTLDKHNRPAQIVGSKDVNETVQRKRSKPGENHPWRHYPIGRSTPNTLVVM